MNGKLIYKILKYIRSSKIITFVVWRIKIEKYLHDTFWDLTTLVLKKELNQNKEKNKYLDMGCGQFAILGQYFKKINSYSDVTSIDVYKEFIENSIKNSIQNKNDINILQSNLFSNINEKFDLISFNPPYVPASTKNEKLEFPNIRYSDLEGIQTAKDFLSEAKKFLTPDGIILLGMNTFYVPQNVCVKLIKDNGYKLEKITKMKFNTSIVLKLKVI
jgi:Methylase of polypeptide chain release factors|tara:strand:+ start:118 stop:768 length:651 start_codon:yes stop_codon:yes gene_type:complete